MRELGERWEFVATGQDGNGLVAVKDDDLDGLVVVSGGDFGDEIAALLLEFGDGWGVNLVAGLHIVVGGFAGGCHNASGCDGRGRSVGGGSGGGRFGGGDGDGIVHFRALQC